MNYDQMHRRNREEVNSHPLTDFVALMPSKNNLFCCPLCGSGTGPHGTGALQVTRMRSAWWVTCYKGCFDFRAGVKGSDTLGALRKIWKCTETEVFRRVGLDTSPDGSGGAARAGGLPSSFVVPQSQIPPGRGGNAGNDGHFPFFVESSPGLAVPEEIETQTTEQATYCEKVIAGAFRAMGNGPAYQYAKTRGFRDEIIRQFRLGYFNSWAGREGLCIPSIRVPYFRVRHLDQREPKISKPSRMKAGPEQPFYWESGPDCETVVAVEGEIDALSVIQAMMVTGATVYDVVALGTNSASRSLNAMLAGKSILLMLDEDPAGAEGTIRSARAILEMGGRPFTTAHPWGGCKDANDVLREAGEEKVMECIMMSDFQKWET